MEVEAKLLEKKSPLDEVDFVSGYEKQYDKEYRPSTPVRVEPPDPKRSWYRNMDTILMVIFLMVIFASGSYAVISKVFSSSFLSILIVFGIYVLVALIFIFLEVKSVHVR